MAQALDKNSVIAVVGSGAMGSGIAQVAAGAGHQVLPGRHPAGGGCQGHRRHRQGLRQAGRKGPHGRSEAELRARAPAARGVDGGIARRGAGGRSHRRRPGRQAHPVRRAGRHRRRQAASWPRTPRRSRSRHRRATAAAGTPGRHALLQPGAADGAGRSDLRRATDASVADTVYATAAAWGKNPVHAKSTPGFIVNRVARPYYAEAPALAAGAGRRRGHAWMP